MSLAFEARPFGLYKNPTPVFNKRVFKAQAGIVLTEEVLKILKQPCTYSRTRHDVHKLKSVVNGLKDIHKGFQFIKDALGIVVGYERVEAKVAVQRQPKEKGLSCYYILTGSIEAVYDINNNELEDFNERERFSSKNSATSDNDLSDDDCENDFLRLRRRQNKKASLERSNSDEFDNPNGTCLISYTHVAGDFLGLVSGDGPEYDLPPPKSIKTLEVCEFLRIDRRRFHEAVRIVHNQYVQEVEYFINSESILRHLPENEREKLVPLIAKQEYPAGKVIVNQGEIPDHVFFIGKGRCQFFRRVFIKEAHRVELVKLGQIEKGEVFGESSVLDGSPCFCSVTSIGQVTCFLINKWAIKTNESFVNLLREHQHIFYEDDMIHHYIRDSDVWQSYKRSQVMELLDTTNKQHISVRKNDIQEVLERALEFGDAKRCHSSRATRHREVGEPRPEEPLFVVPRSRRRSSAILQSNAAAVVKAVLLLRRNIGNKPDIQLPPIKPKPQRVKPVSAPSRYRSKTAPLSHTKDYRSKNNNQSESVLTDERPRTTGDSLRTRTSRSASRSERNKIKAREKSRGFSSSEESLVEDSKRTRVKTPKSKKESNKTNSTSKEKSESTNSKAIVNENRTTDLESLSDDDISQHAPGIERIVSLDKNFIIKEIINTGNPKKQTLPYQYQRFDKSMFSILDGEETADKKSGPSPWDISLVASKWMSRIRRKRLQARAEKDSLSTPSPTPPPLIVIEEYAPLNGQELGSDDDADEAVRKRPIIRSLSTPSPSLEQLDEENDEEIDEYDRQEAGKALEEKWYTAIHEARDESRSYLKQLRIDVEELKKNRDKRKYKEQETKTLEASAEHQLSNNQEESNSSDVKKGTDLEIENVANSNQKIRKHSTARSVATSSASDSKTIGSSKSRKSSRMGRQSVHYSADQVICPVVQYRPINTIVGVKTKHEKRRLLLLDKVGLQL